MVEKFSLHKKYAQTLDKEDPLKRFIHDFYIRPNEIYLDGNSLGLMSKSAEKSLQRVIGEWKELGIRGWLEGDPPWYYFAEKLSFKIAPLLGVKANEIITHSSTTVNIHLLLATMYKIRSSGDTVLMDSLTFPSDRYAVESQLNHMGKSIGKHLKIVDSKDDYLLDEQDIIDMMTEDVGLVFLPSVLYRSGQLLDIATLTREAHARDILIGFDCAHSIGAVPHQFAQWDVDFACWCTYKYLNGGPGAAAGLYINRKHIKKTTPAMAGWWGCQKDKQFDMSETFYPAKDAGGWQIGTPHLFSMAPIEGALKVHNKAGIERIRRKSLQLTSYLMELSDKLLVQHGFSIKTPRQDERRGGHVALAHPDSIRINDALIARDVIPDFRYPDTIRLAPVALYTSFEDVYDAVQIIKEIMETKAHQNFSKVRKAVA